MVSDFYDPIYIWYCGIQPSWSQKLLSHDKAPTVKTERESRTIVTVRFLVWTFWFYRYNLIRLFGHKFLMKTKLVLCLYSININIHYNTGFVVKPMVYVPNFNASLSDLSGMSHPMHLHINVQFYFIEHPRSSWLWLIPRVLYRCLTDDKVKRLWHWATIHPRQM